MDLTLTHLNFTTLNFVIPHVGGAFPAIEDHFLTSSPALEARAKEAYKTRFWWDSAGPTYFAQVKGLLGYDEPINQLLFGTVSLCCVDGRAGADGNVGLSLRAELRVYFLDCCDQQHRLLQRDREGWHLCGKC